MLIMVAGSGVFASAVTFDPIYLLGTPPGIYTSSPLAVTVLFALPVCLSRNYVTKMVSAER